MGNDLIVKANDVIKASYQLTANEQRLILSAIAQIPKGVPVSDRTIYPIKAENFIELGVHPKTAYREMNDAIERLYERNVIIKQGETIIKTRWVQMIIKMDRDWIRDNYHFYNEGYQQGDEFLVEQAFPADYCIIGIKFSEAVLPFLSNLTNNFTQYLKQDIAGLSSAYAIRFYELIMQYKSTGYVKLSLADLRNMLDLGSKYEATKDLKVRVIETAINEINKKTPIKVNYELLKTGRKFTHLELKFKPKKESKPTVKNPVRDPNTPDFFIDMTDSQRHLFANKMSEMPEMSKYSQGTESYQQFAVRIAEMLLQPEKFRELYPVLEKAGFK